MEKLKLLFVIPLILQLNLFSQNENNPVSEYMELWVNYSITKEGITCRMNINAGSDKGHSLYGLIKEGEADNIIILDDNIALVFNNEIDILNYLSATGWKIFDIEVVNLLAKDHIKYLLYREKPYLKNSVSE